MIIAIDGPAGAGKSTIAFEVAKRLGYQLVDTGAIYRSVAWHARDRGIAIEDGPALAELAESLTFRFAIEEERNIVICNEREMGNEIRTPSNSQAASVVSAHPEVRAALLDVQRTIGRERPSVLEGRDIGTVVFPDADVKIFLTASPEVRASRRLDQIEEKSGVEGDFRDVLSEIKRRDERDSTRAAAPLKKADDAVEIDSSACGIEEVLNLILDEVERAGQR